MHFPVQVPTGFRGSRVSAKGKLCLPEPETGWRPRIWDSFLAPRGQYKHHAIDIVAAEGTQVRSTVAGRVLDYWQTRPGAGWSEKGGWYVWIQDAEGGLHYYAHLLRKPLVRPGQRVSEGQLIGYVGRTGNATTTCPHLHYAITSPRGSKVNPYPLLEPLYNEGAWKIAGTAGPGGSALILVLAAAAGIGAWLIYRR